MNSIQIMELGACLANFGMCSCFGFIFWPGYLAFCLFGFWLFFLNPALLGATLFIWLSEQWFPDFGRSKLLELRILLWAVRATWEPVPQECLQPLSARPGQSVSRVLKEPVGIGTSSSRHVFVHHLFHSFKTLLFALKKQFSCLLFESL